MDRTKSIEQLEDDYWGEPKFDSGLVVDCHAFRKIPICDLTPNQVRTLIGQKVGVPLLLKIAIEFLENDILEDGDMYPGHVLKQVLEFVDSLEETHLAERLLKALNSQRQCYIVEFDEEKFDNVIAELEDKLQN